MSLSIVMPAWNEAEGIAEFIIELDNSFPNLDTRFYIVNDCSTDETIGEVNKLKEKGINIHLHNNVFNSGHGPSTITALKLGVTSQTKIVIAVDGDGQFTGQDVARVYSEISSEKFDLVEGNRINRDDQFYRRLASFVTRQLIASRTGKRPIDANTPLRAYKSSTLSSFIELLPPNTLIPNLFISAISRKKNYKIGFVNVSFIPRRGSIKVGSTWGKSRSYIPSKKFIIFCISAVKEWVTLKI